MSNMASNTVVRAAPPAPPGPATFDYSRFKGNAATLMLDSQTLTLNANTVNTCRLRAYGDPADPLAPTISAPAIATQILYAPYFDASNTAQFNPTVLLGNTSTYFTEGVFVQKSVTVGAPFNWTPPQFSTLSKVIPVLNRNTFGQAYPLNGGQLRGYAPLYVPQPPLATQGSIIDLNGGTVSGYATLFR